MASVYTTRITQNKWLIIFFFRQFLVKEPHHSENIIAEKRYTSTAAPVVFEACLVTAS